MFIDFCIIDVLVPYQFISFYNNNKRKDAGILMQKDFFSRLSLNVFNQHQVSLVIVQIILQSCEGGSFFFNKK